jgi:hypothetical protein
MSLTYSMRGESVFVSDDSEGAEEEEEEEKKKKKTEPPRSHVPKKGARKSASSYTRLEDAGHLVDTAQVDEDDEKSDGGADVGTDTSTANVTNAKTSQPAPAFWARGMTPWKR